MEEIIVVTITALLFLVLPVPVAIITGLIVAMRIGYLAFNDKSLHKDSSLEIQFLAATVIASVIAFFVPALKVQLLFGYVAILSLLRFLGRMLSINNKKKVDTQEQLNEVNAKLVEKLINEKMGEYFGQLDTLKEKLDQSIDSAVKKANGMMSAEEVDKLLSETRAKNEQSIREATALIESNYEKQKQDLQKKYACQLETEKRRIEQEARAHASSSNQAKKEAEAKIQELKNKLESVIQIDKEKLELERTNAQKQLDKMKGEYEAEHHKMEQTIKSLNMKIAQIYKEQDTYIQELENKNKEENEIIEAVEIKKRFNRALSTAKKELDIFSPWMNSYIVNNDFKNKLEQLLQKGVVVKIRYGIGFGNGSGDSDRNTKTEKIANELQIRFNKYKNFHLYKDNSHAKLYICDDEFYVLSSFNILSYDGGIHSKDKRGELGEYSKNKKMIEAYRNKFFFF